MNGQRWRIALANRAMDVAAWLVRPTGYRPTFVKTERRFDEPTVVRARVEKQGE
jgi:hypothetical protein